METFPWADEVDCAVTVCDTEGVILYMNEKARATFAKHGDLIGRNLFDCHVRKMIYQTAWKEHGEIRGLVEISMEIPAEMPHYIRK